MQGASPFLPNKAMFKSDCSDLVGIPVEGPARCTSTITKGNSVITANPIASAFNDNPGPEVVVQAIAPA
jgi:hypothetical protein